jgi:hypothetical protein
MIKLLQSQLILEIKGEKKERALPTQHRAGISIVHIRFSKQLETHAVGVLLQKVS